MAADVFNRVEIHEFDVKIANRQGVDFERFKMPQNDPVESLEIFETFVFTAVHEISSSSTFLSLGFLMG